MCEAFKSRIVLIFGSISDGTAAEAARRLIALDADSDDPTDMIVSSPGGHLESGDTIHDLIRFIRAPVRMIGSGWVGSAATHIYLAAPRERRFCLPNTRFLIHQPSGGVGGKAADIAIQAQEIVRARRRDSRPRVPAALNRMSAMQITKDLVETNCFQGQ